MQLNIKQIETFYWAAKLGSFTAAAERLFATQSTVSMRISELESSLGVKLFDRRQRNARLTPKGRQLLTHAERLITVMDELVDQVATTDAMSGLVRMGVAEVVSLTWLPGLVKAVHQRYPRIDLELDEALSGDLLDRLEQGKLDIVFAPGIPSGVGYEVIALGDVEFRWMAGPGFQPPDAPLRPHDLANHPIVALSPESYHHRTIEAWFCAAGVHSRRIDTCKSMSVIAALVGADLGVGLLPTRCFQRELDDGRLQLLDTDPPMSPVTFYALLHRDIQAPVTRAVAELSIEVSDFSA